MTYLQAAVSEWAKLKRGVDVERMMLYGPLVSPSLMKQIPPGEEMAYRAYIRAAYAVLKKTGARQIRAEVRRERERN